MGRLLAMQREMEQGSMKLKEELFFLERKSSQCQQQLEEIRVRLLSELERGTRLTSELSIASSRCASLQAQWEEALQARQVTEALLQTQADKAASALSGKDAQIRQMAEQARSDVLNVQALLDEALANSATQEGRRGQLEQAFEELTSKAVFLENAVENLRSENQARKLSSDKLLAMQDAWQAECCSLKNANREVEGKLETAACARKDMEEKHAFLLQEKDTALQQKDDEMKLLRDKCNALEHDVKRFQVLFSDELAALNMVDGSPHSS